MDRWETLKTFIFYNLTLSVLNFYAFLSYLVISNLNYYVSLGIFVNVMSMLNFESIIIQPEEALEIKAKYCSRHVFKLEEKNLKSFLTPKKRQK